MNELNYEQKYFAKALAQVYRCPWRYSAYYKQGLYDKAARESAIHFEALRINAIRLRRRGA